MTKLRLWWTERLFDLYIWWERLGMNKNEIAEHQAHQEGKQGSRYIEGKSVKVKRSKATSSNR